MLQTYSTHLTRTILHRRSLQISGIFAMFLLILGCGGNEPKTDVPIPTSENNQESLQAVITTDKGIVIIDLATQSTPRLAANFANLVRRKFFDGLTFYRSSTVMRQAGNPFNIEGTYYRTGYRLVPEFAADLKFDEGGVVAMPLWSDDQLAYLRATEFFITVKPQERWTFKYPIFARVIEGKEVVLNLVDGSLIRTSRLKGNPAALFESHAELLDTWNAALDARPTSTSTPN